jgi:hypothetical protein
MAVKFETEVRDRGSVAMLEADHGQVSGCVRWFLVGVLLSLLSATPSRALEPVPGEAKALEDCDRRLCTILLKKDVMGDDLKCDLTKTWARSTIKGADSPGLTWGFGDARCLVHLQITRALLITALTAKAYKLWVPPHTAECVVEQSGQMKTIKATLAPKIEFKNGRVEKIWINLQGMEGTSSITGLLSAGATLVDSTGLFHSQMIKEANKYIYAQCPKNYPEVLADSAPKAKPKKPAKTTLPSGSVAPK